MRFNDHSAHHGRHALLSPSKYHWDRYTLERLEEVYNSSQASQLGVELHTFAYNSIRLGIKLPRGRNTLNKYVNHAIQFGMKPEQVLYYSENAFGTADAIGFDEEKNILRIHDLKTGETPASMRQLEIYTCFFCLEYDYDPNEIEIELRIYQSNRIIVHRPNPDSINELMEKLILFDRHISMLKLRDDTS